MDTVVVTFLNHVVRNRLIQKFMARPKRSSSKFGVYYNKFSACR